MSWVHAHWLLAKIFFFDSLMLELYVMIIKVILNEAYAIVLTGLLPSNFHKLLGSSLIVIFTPNRWSHNLDNFT